MFLVFKLSEKRKESERHTPCGARASLDTCARVAKKQETSGGDGGGRSRRRVSESSSFFQKEPHPGDSTPGLLMKHRSSENCQVEFNLNSRLGAQIYGFPIIHFGAKLCQKISDAEFPGWRAPIAKRMLLICDPKTRSSVAGPAKAIYSWRDITEIHGPE